MKEWERREDMRREDRAKGREEMMRYEKGAEENAVTGKPSTPLSHLRLRSYMDGLRSDSQKQCVICPFLTIFVFLDLNGKCCDVKEKCEGGFIRTTV